MANRGPPGEHLRFGGNAGKSVDEYWEYTRIVGNDDGGKLFSPEEYESYKREVLPMRLKNRVYVSWTSPTGMDCVLVGPETPCFCGHRFKQHQTDFKELPKSRPIPLPCKEAGCPCSSYTYVPKNGSQAIRCGCKHTTDEHRPSKPYNCLKANCKCATFKSSYTCNCGEPCHAHKTLVETKEEREARGHPVGHDVPYQAMGGITGFSSLADGYLRLDPSGRGRPGDEFFEQPIGSTDHPMLRQFAYADSQVGPDGSVQLSKEAMSQQRRAGESELDFYERRYQERMKQERTSKPKPVQMNPYDSSAKLSTGSRNPPNTKGKK